MQSDGKVNIFSIAAVLVIVFIFAFVYYALAETAPPLEWTRQYGGTPSFSDFEFGHAIDSKSGYIYVSGYTGSAFSGETASGAGDGYVRKYDNLGNHIWTDQYGTVLYDDAPAITVYSDNIYITGYTDGTFPGETAQGAGDSYVRKYNEAGAHLWTKQFGTIDYDEPTAITSDASGIYVGGYTYSNFPGETNAGDADYFIRKYDINGNHIWTKQYGTTLFDYITGISIYNDNIYVSGYTDGTFPGETAYGAGDPFIAKYDTNGTRLWLKQFGTAANDRAQGISSSATGVYIAGYTSGTFTGETYLGSTDAFVAKYDTNGNQQWVREFGTSSQELAFSVNSGNNVYITGYTRGTFPDQTSYGDADVFIQKYDSNGILQWSKQFGTSLFDRAFSISRYYNELYVSGDTKGTFSGQTSSGGTDAFVSKLPQDKDTDGEQDAPIGPSLPPQAAQPTGSIGYFPEVIIKSPKAGDLFSKSVEISYAVTDENDVSGPADFGLGSSAVSIFYSKDDGENWLLIAENLPPIGFYTWNTENQEEGNFYKIRVFARDKSLQTGKKESEVFGIDKTPPLFDISVEPPFSKGENVIIKIQANEALRERPKIIVKQRNYADIEIAAKGEGALWESIYEVRPVADGTAKITVEGTDISGLVGNVIRKGGFFNVGINPPPTPIIISPLDNDIVDALFIDIVGKIREDTKAVLFLNGEKVRSISPAGDGSFTIKKVELSKTFNKSVNALQVFSEDLAGNLSEPASISIKFNINPVIKITRPRAGETIAGEATIQAEAYDGNNDKLSFSIEASLDKGTTWQEVAKDLSSAVYSWDTSLFSDGAYILRMFANDGFVQVTATSSEFFVQNLVPIVSFAEEKIVTNKDSVILSGFAESVLVSRTASILDVEYSIDGGRKWLQAEARDGVFDSKKEEFSINLIGLKEGFYKVLARATDNRGFRGEGSMILIVDFGPPRAVTIFSPKNGEIFGYKNDLDLDKAGIQVNIRGSSEPDNRIVITNGDALFEGEGKGDGRFSVEITLRKHGENVFKISSIDRAGNKSEAEISLTLILNNPPDLKFLRPKAGGAIGGIYDIVFEAQDPDLDAIAETILSYRKRGSALQNVIARNPEVNTVSFNAGNLAEGFYEFVLEASDGVSRNSLIREFIIDNTAPKINFVPLAKTSFAESFTLEMRGSATDASSPVEYIEYSIDLENWYQALITYGYGTKSVGFRVKHPFELPDGSYDVSFRATDSARNVSDIASPQTIFIDTTPPRIGSYILKTKNFSLMPEGENFSVAAGTDAGFTISLEQDTASATVSGFGKVSNLIKKEGLWRAEISFAELGNFDILVSAEDLLGNTTRNKKIGSIEIVPKGRVVSNEGVALGAVKMTVFVFDADTQTWREWQAEEYDLANPIYSASFGEYDLLLPSGIYQITLRREGFERLKSGSFELANPSFITVDFTMEKRKGVRGILENLIEKIGNFQFSIFNFQT